MGRLLVTLLIVLRGSLVLLAALLSSCSAWRPVMRGDDWTLYRRGDAVRDAAEFEPDPLERLIPIAVSAVEDCMGPFEHPVRIHVVPPEDVHGARLGWSASRAGGVRDIPGIGPARIPGWHTRSGGGPFAPSGIFVRVTDVGTLVHELVHARLDQEPFALPLWFEEGIATFYGDGIEVDNRWVIDGLACWPLRELRQRSLDRRDIERLLSIKATDHSSMEDNVLLHFLGWAVVFDLYRSSGSHDWRRWWNELDHWNLAQDVAARLERTLERQTPVAWMRRLDDPDPAQRMAAAKGTWKLRTSAVQRKLVDRLAVESHPEVRAALAVNALAATAELFGRGRDGWRRIFSALAQAQLEDPDEQAAMTDLFRAYHGATDSRLARSALERLGRLWDE